MTRKEAVEAIYNVINSGIIDDELNDQLTEVCNCLCGHSEFDKCKIDPRCKSGYPNYCEGCPHLKED